MKVDEALLSTRELDAAIGIGASDAAITAEELDIMVDESLLSTRAAGVRDLADRARAAGVGEILVKRGEPSGLLVPLDHADPYTRYVVATRTLRDAELAIAKAREDYGQALRELNAAIAPLPGNAQAEQQSP